jgi:hypothetical protein
MIGLDFKTYLFTKKDREMHHANARAAYDDLLNRHIPEMARLLTVFDATHVTRTLQQRGINCRFLGLVRMHITDPILRVRKFDCEL